MAEVYQCGKDEGHEEGYKQGFDEGRSDEGVQAAYNRGRNECTKQHRNWLYDPFTYGDAYDYVSTDVSMFGNKCNDILNEEQKKNITAELGEGWNARMVVVKKPTDYEKVALPTPAEFATPWTNHKETEEPETKEEPETVEEVG